jgi:hypothetical protein
MKCRCSERGGHTEGAEGSALPLRLQAGLRFFGVALYGVYKPIFEKLRQTGVEGHRRASAVLRTDFTENSPPHTPNVDEESRGIYCDRRFVCKLTSVCATPAPFFTSGGSRLCHMY